MHILYSQTDIINVTFIIYNKKKQTQTFVILSVTLASLMFFYQQYFKILALSNLQHLCNAVCDLNIFLKYFVARPMMTSSKRHPTRTQHRGLLPSRGDSKSCKASCWLWWPSSSPRLSDSASSSLGDKQMLRSSNTKEGRKCFI